MMKSSILNKPQKNLQDYERLIEDGYILDVKGNWIPLNEKVKKERIFVCHLEAGDVLKSGKWVSISDATRIQKELKKNSPVPEQNTTPVTQITLEQHEAITQKPEEKENIEHISPEKEPEELNVASLENIESQIEIDIDGINISDVLEEPANLPVSQIQYADAQFPEFHNENSIDTDFPPETIVMPTEEIDRIKNLYMSQNKLNNLQSDFSQQNYDTDDETCMETIAMPISSIPNSLVLQSTEEDSWERSRNRHKKTIIITSAISGLIAILLIAGILIKI